MHYTTRFSPCRSYRYELWRKWSDGPFCLFIGLNPSTADETHDDPTIRKCVAYAKRWRFGALCMANLFAWCATDPRDMMAVADPVGPDNDRTLNMLAGHAGLTVAAWGNDGAHLNRDLAVREAIHILHCLGRNKDGSPKHPLYLRGDLFPVRY